MTNHEAPDDGVLAAATALIRERVTGFNGFTVQPTFGIILGSGLGALADEIEPAVRIPFADLPGFVASTAVGHRGELILGSLFGRPTVAMAGRFHRYEGHSSAAVMFPVHVLAALGVRTLIVSNAAGGLNPDYCVGDIVVLRDHIDMMRAAQGISLSDLLEATPASKSADGRGTHQSGWPNRLSREVYDREWRDVARSAALAAGFIAHSGTYLGTLGPNYETRAEYRMMRHFGADLAGMSTIPEVLAAAHHGIRVLALSMVSNVANPDRPEIASHDEVLKAGEAAASKMRAIVRAILESDSGAG